RTFRQFVSIILTLGLLMGIPMAQDATPVSAQETEAEDVSASGLRALIEQLASDGEIVSDQFVRNLFNQLTDVEHYEDKGVYQKAVKPMSGFMGVVERLSTVGSMNESRTEQISEYASELSHKWDTTFDSNRAMESLWNLSVDIGPRIAGEQGERDAAN